MSEQLPDRPTEGHPIAAGLVALVGVTVAVGLILGLLVVGGSHVLGVGGDEDSTASSAERSMYLPKPEKTPTATSPQFTFDPGDGASSSASGGAGAGKPTRSESPRKQITLSAASTTAGPMEPFDLTGVYPGGEGAILQVQRFQDGSWQDFNATTSVSDETFQTPIQTSQAGVNRFRVVDTDTQLESNEVRITIG